SLWRSHVESVPYSIPRITRQECPIKVRDETASVRLGRCECPVNLRSRRAKIGLCRARIVSYNSTSLSQSVSGRKRWRRPRSGENDASLDEIFELTYEQPPNLRRKRRFI